MIVAELAAYRQFRLVDQAVPDPGPGEVQVQVHAVGICGSDIHYYSEGGIGDTPCVYPAVIGHEPTGTVLRTGSGVSGWQLGDRAVLEPAIYCYHCEYCMTGRHNVCKHIRFLSTPGEPGFFRQVVNLPAVNVLPLPRNLSFEEGTLFEPLAIVLHSIKFADPRPGETGVVFGAGPIGLLTMSALKMAGVKRVFVVERVEHRLELARSMGADVCLNPRSVDVVQEIRKETGGRGVDFAMDCAAKDGTMDWCLYATRATGRVVYTGIPSEQAVPINWHEVRRKELVLYNVRRSNHETNVALKLMETEMKRFAPVLTHAMPMTKIASAFEMLERHEGNATKVTIHPLNV